MHIVKVSKGADTAVFDLAAVITAKSNAILDLVALKEVFGKELSPATT